MLLVSCYSLKIVSRPWFLVFSFLVFSFLVFSFLVFLMQTAFNTHYLVRFMKRVTCFLLLVSPFLVLFKAVSFQCTLLYAIYKSCKSSYYQQETSNEKQPAVSYLKTLTA